MIQLKENLDFAGRYCLLKLLGRGGFSEVWLANDNLTHLQIVIKVYAPGQGMDEDGLHMFGKELANVYDLNHSFLLKPQHVDSWEGMPYLIMSYCPNGSLVKAIGALSEEEMWKMLHQVASGLAYLHERDVIHQDIKPDNILIDDHRNYVITDFGISMRARSTLRKSLSSSSVSSAGTTAYMGPERFSKQPAPIKASDIWSLGATLFEILEGNAPFGELGGTLQKNGADIPDITAPVSNALKEVITQMLAVQPWDRPTAAQLAEWANHPSSISKSRVTLKKSTPEIVANTQRQTKDTPIPKRHWIVTAGMIGMSLLFGVMAAFYCVDLISIDRGFYLSSDNSAKIVALVLLYLFIFLLQILFFISAWRNSRTGYLLCIAFTVMELILVFPRKDYLWSMVLIFIALAILSLLFLIKKEGVSAWQRFQYGPQKLWKPKSWISVTIASLCYVGIFSFCLSEKAKVESSSVQYENLCRQYHRALNVASTDNINAYNTAYFALRDLYDIDDSYVIWEIRQDENSKYSKRIDLSKRLKKDYQKMQTRYRTAKDSSAKNSAKAKRDQLKKIMDSVDKLHR